MKWRTWILGAGTALFLWSGAAASDLAEAAKALPPLFALRPLPGTEWITFNGQRFPYQAAQLTADMKRQDMFLAGYLFYGELPEEEKAGAAPYFRYNLGEKEYEGLAAVNVSFFNEDTPLHKALQKSLSQWADQMIGGEGARLTVTLDHIEPIRRTADASFILYTAGTRVTLSSGGFILPLYGRAYMYRDGSAYRVLVLITSDDSRQPMTYALDDMAKKAAAEAARRDLAAYVRDLKGENEAGK